MNTLLTWANNNIGTELSEAVVTIMIVSFFLSVIFEFLTDTKWTSFAGKFSPEFRKTLTWVFVFFVISAFSQDMIMDIKVIFSANFYGGIGYLIGSLIGLIIFPILITYFIRLFFPLFKWIHNKTQ